MRTSKLVALAIGMAVTGGSLAFLARGQTSPKPVPQRAQGDQVTSRITFIIPRPPRLVSAMLGVDPKYLEPLECTPRDVIGSTSIADLARQVSGDATLERRAPEYRDQFDPEDADFDREALARDLAGRISLTTEPGSELLVLRVTAESERVSRELCDLVATTLEFRVRDSQLRTLNKASECVGRMQRTLRTDEMALRAQCENLIANESLESADANDSSATATLSAVCNRLLDAELELAGTSEDDPATAEKRAKRDWLRLQRDGLVKVTSANLCLSTRLRTIERDLEAREASRTAVDRAALAYSELIEAPIISRIEKQPVTE